MTMLSSGKQVALSSLAVNLEFYPCDIYLHRVFNKKNATLTSSIFQLNKSNYSLKLVV